LVERLGKPAILHVRRPSSQATFTLDKTESEERRKLETKPAFTKDLNNVATKLPQQRLAALLGSL